ncbi:alpha/beta hydrolase [Streptomyces katsurahamanus]|uniref:Alpha/beta hydrolase n=2 Tax=Streptomyces katsurahamanus TaxID=2577098 RepID=A0ABW9P0Q0_9ACTN|nr:alpha/beta hydrolase [Streptomyces katsurahamanus]
MTSEPAGRFHTVDGSMARSGSRYKTTRTTLIAADGVRIDAEYRPSAEGASATAVVLAHGLTHSLDRPAVRRAAAVFAQRAAVVTFSFRGHGRSGGRSTVGDREVLDLAAAVRWARTLGHPRVVTVGFSMGGSVVLRHAALSTDGRGPAAGTDRGRIEARTAREGARARPSAPTKAATTASEAAPKGVPEAVMAGPGPEPSAHADAVVSVSAPARWYYRGTAPMRRLHWMITHPLGRLVGRYGLRTRIQGRAWDPVPLSPVAAVPLIAPVPLLIVHGDRDPYFPLDHPRALAAAGPAELWIEPGMGHTSYARKASGDPRNADDDRLFVRIAQWLAAPEPPAHGP